MGLSSQEAAARLERDGRNVVVPELRGFEVFSLGRPAEDMPQITSRICGVCPTAQACVDGRCGGCRTDADCCEPLVCNTANQRCESIPP